METDYFSSPFRALESHKKFKWFSVFLCCFLMMLRNFHYFYVFYLSDGSASKKIVITDCSGLTDSVFYFAFSLLQVFKWILSWKSGHLSLVTVDNILSSWLVNFVLLEVWEKIILWCTNLLMMKAVKFWCEGSFHVLIEENDPTWSRRVKKIKLGEAYLPSIFQEDSSI